MDNTKELTHISLCAGYGGIDLGLRKALKATRTICFVEIEAFAAENLVAKIEAGQLDPAPVFTDLKQFPWELFSGRVDILSGGFPCQPFSTSGKREGDEDPRHLWPYIVRGIERLGRPPLVFLENVEGIISSKLKGDNWSDPADTPVLQHVLRELERLGYHATAGIFSAREVGATHQRKRVFIMGCRADLGKRGRDLVSGLLNNGSAMGNTKSRKDRQREFRALVRAQPEKRGEKWLSPCSSGRGCTAYPAPRNAAQYPCEPPRVTMGDTKHERLQRHEPQSQSSGPERWETPSRLVTAPSISPGAIQREAESAVGGDANGVADWLDYAELCNTVQNRTDELRMLGNGVVPDTAAKAFEHLWLDLQASFNS